MQSKKTKTGDDGRPFALKKVIRFQLSSGWTRGWKLGRFLWKEPVDD
jgi:hypothetical protein